MYLLWLLTLPLYTYSDDGPALVHALINSWLPLVSPDKSRRLAITYYSVDLIYCLYTQDIVFSAHHIGCLLGFIYLPETLETDIYQAFAAIETTNIFIHLSSILPYSLTLVFYKYTFFTGLRLIYCLNCLVQIYHKGDFLIKTIATCLYFGSYVWLYFDVY